MVDIYSPKNKAHQTKIARAKSMGTSGTLCVHIVDSEPLYFSSLQEFSEYILEPFRNYMLLPEYSLIHFKKYGCSGIEFRNGRVSPHASGYIAAIEDHRGILYSSDYPPYRMNHCNDEITEWVEELERCWEELREAHKKIYLV